MSSYDPPRAPVRVGKSQRFDLPDGYERSMQNFHEASREEARRTHRLNQEATQVAKYINAISGNQWGSNTRKWRSKFVDNRIAKSRYDHLAQLTDTRPIIDVATSVDACKNTAKVIAASIRSNWTRLDVDLKLVTAADIADAYGTGFWRLGGAKPGIMNVLPCGPDQVMPIQPGFDIQDSSAVLFRTWKSIHWLKRKFPFSTANIERELVNQPMYGAQEGQNASYNRPSHIDEITWNGLSQAMRRVLAVKGGAPVMDASIGQYYKTMEVEELFLDDPTINDSTNEIVVSDPFLSFDQHNWWYTVKPGGRLFPRKRHMVFAGSRLISDGPSPYWHGLYPFATLRFNPVFWSFWGLSKYRDLLPINMAMNEIVAACMDLITRALNPTAMTKEGAISSTQWNQFYPDMPGMKLRVGANQPLSDAMKYMDPPNIPGYVVEMLKGWLAPEFDRMSGAIDVGGLGKKKQVPGAETLDSMRDSQNTGLRLEERMLEVFLRDAGQQVVSNEIQFSTAEYRLMRLGEQGLTKEDFNGDLGNMLPEDLDAQPDYHKQYAMTITSGSMHSGAKDRDKQVAVSLAAKHMFPIQSMYERLEIPNPEQEFKKLLDEQKQMGAAAGAKPVGGGAKGKK